MYGKEQVEFLINNNYIQEGETIEQRIAAVADVVRKHEHKYSKGLGDRIEDYITKQILSLSTPQWANMGRKKEQGSTPLPVSCNIITYPNSIQGIYYAHGEAAMLSKLGAGVGAGFTKVADKGTKISKGFYSNPKLDWIEDFVRTTQKVSQGTRRGYGVPFISIDDPEFYDVMDRVSKNNPNSHDPLVENNVGIILPKGFRDRVRNGDKEAQKRFLIVCQERQDIGKIYIGDVENLNKNCSPVYSKLGHIVDSLNICMEACTPSYDDKTFTCVLSSLNLVHWDTIKENPQIIKDCIMFLDIVVEDYIELTDGVPFMEKARRSAIEKRDIGLGTLGFAELLQMKGFAYGDVGSRTLNKQIYKTIRQYAEEATKEMATKLGSAPMCAQAGLVRRNVSLLMLAPNKSTSFICGNTTPGIEPNRSNVFVKALSGIQVVVKNKYLEKLLIEKGKNDTATWKTIIDNIGSVQHLDFLSQREKNIFKTASEISPKDIIDLAADRQEFIDMSQSLNLFNRPNYTLKDIYDIHMYAFDKGIKALYYLYPQVHAAFEKAGERWDACVSCAD